MPHRWHTSSATPKTICGACPGKATLLQPFPVIALPSNLSRVHGNPNTASYPEYCPEGTESLPWSRHAICVTFVCRWCDDLKPSQLQPWQPQKHRQCERGRSRASEYILSQEQGERLFPRKGSHVKQTNKQVFQLQGFESHRGICHLEGTFPILFHCYLL